MSDTRPRLPVHASRIVHYFLSFFHGKITHGLTRISSSSFSISLLLRALLPRAIPRTIRLPSASGFLARRIYDGRSSSFSIVSQPPKHPPPNGKVSSFLLPLSPFHVSQRGWFGLADVRELCLPDIVEPTTVLRVTVSNYLSGLLFLPSPVISLITPRFCVF